MVNNYDKPSKKYKKLLEQLPDIEQTIKEDKINVVPLPTNLKKPLIPKWNERKYSITDSFTYKTKKGKKVTQPGLKYHRGNYGILIGYNNSMQGYSIACIDIDGYTLPGGNTEKKDQLKEETKRIIYEALKEIPNSLQVKTQSGGYHIYLWTRKTLPSTSSTSQSLYFPPDFQIKELAGKCLKNSIEIFSQEDNKQTVLPGSTIFNEATGKIRSYKVLDGINKLSDIAIVDDINQLVIDTLTSKGYTYKKSKDTSKPNLSRNHSSGTLTSSKNNNLKELDKEEITQVIELVTPIFKLTDGGKHTTALYLGGYFSYHITQNSCNKIVNGLIKNIGNLFNDTKAFKKTILQNYERLGVDKAGLPKLNEYILSFDKTFNVNRFTDKLNSICNQNSNKKEVGSVKIDGKEIPIFLYEDEATKWIKYENIITGLDLILNLNTLIGSFRNSQTNTLITTFEFKFKNYFFDIKPKKELESINYFLSEENKELPKFFIEIIRNSLSKLDTQILNPKVFSKEVQLKKLFDERERIDYARKELGNYLYHKGVILRRSIGTPYLLNPKTNGYDSVNLDDLVDFVNQTNDFTLNSISTDDVKASLGYNSKRVTPKYNIVKFPNKLFDMETFRVIENTDEPILTLTEVRYNYNPEAKGNKVVKFLESSLKQKEDTPEKVQERVTSIYEMIGYILTSGNPLNAWFIITGTGGAGKGVLTRLITSIFGSDKVGNLQLQELTPDNRFATSHLENKQVNIVRDSPKTPIEDTGMLKSITGYDDIPIEHKGMDKYTLPKEEVPDMITVCNNTPRFKEGFDESLLQRAIIYEFLNKFRGDKTKENPNLEKEILQDPEEMEFLIYQGIQAYKTMVDNGKDFKARISPEETAKRLGKHTDPIRYALPLLVKYNSRAEEDNEDPIFTNELNNLILFICKEEGLNITNLDDKGLIQPRTLVNKIREEFNLDKTYKVQPTNIGYQNGKLKSKRAYPNLCKTPEYDNYLEKYKNSLKQEEENIED